MILVDSSVWIDFFRGKAGAQPLLGLIDEGRIITNDLILAELVPSMRNRGEHKLEELMHSIAKAELRIEWTEVIDVQTELLSSGYGHVGIPDLIIVQNAKQHGLSLLANDKHFRVLSELLGVKLHLTV